MRHGHGYRKLGRDPSARKALFKNLAVALIKQERIITTLPKAKELRRSGDKLITMAKKNTVHSKKKAWGWLRNEELMEKLFGPLRERFLTRSGGYTRVLKTPNRKGDNAPMAVIELVDNRFPPLRDDFERSRKGRYSLQRGGTDPDVSTGIDALSEAIAGLDLESRGNSAQPDLPGPESRYLPEVEDLDKEGKSKELKRDNPLGTPV